MSTRHPLNNMKDWRSLVIALACLVHLAFPIPAVALEPFSLADVEEVARGLAAKPFQPAEQVPKPLLSLGYDDWRKIRFKTDNSLWREQRLPFELQFFAPGFFYERPVKINIVSEGRPEPLTVPTDFFDFSQTAGLREQLPQSIGVAGFRVHTAILTQDYLDEFLVFLGASYFRAVGKGQGYGLSARGLAVDTALPKGEEFPFFREFWIVKPGPQDKELTIYALLDSESVTGAYAFKARAGEETVMEVSCRLFTRKAVKKLGIAPLTSMFMYGENSVPGQRMDWRPEIHDSDGLQINFRSGEWLWRPLSNPQSLHVHVFEADNVLGFGLMQRDTRFESYQDLEARMENRPSLWIEPRGEWGHGSVELVQIPSDKEIHDNIVAYWTPRQPVEAGKALSYEYRMRWHKCAGANPPGVMTMATRSSRLEQGGRIFVVDFVESRTGTIRPESDPQAVVNAGPGAKILEQQVYRNPATGGWRLSFKAAHESKGLADVLPEKRAPVDLRAFLRFPGGDVSETWNFVLSDGK